MPDRHLRPRAVMRRSGANQIAPLATGAGAALEHGVERFLHVCRGPIRQARDDGPARKNLRVRGQHDRGHGAARGQAGDIDARPGDAMIEHHALDHLPDRQSFAAFARRVRGAEPGEAAVGIVRAFLLGQQQGEAEAIGHGRPAGAVIVSAGRLRAPVQDDNQGRGIRETFGTVAEHAQIAGVRAEALDFGKTRGWRARRVPSTLGLGRSQDLFPFAAVAGEFGGGLS